MEAIGDVMPLGWARRAARPAVRTSPSLSAAQYPLSAASGAIPTIDAAPEAAARPWVATATAVVRRPAAARPPGLAAAATALNATRTARPTRRAVVPG